MLNSWDIASLNGLPFFVPASRVITGWRDFSIGVGVFLRCAAGTR